MVPSHLQEEGVEEWADGSCYHGGEAGVKMLHIHGVPLGLRSTPVPWSREAHGERTNDFLKMPGQSCRTSLSRSRSQEPRNWSSGIVGCTSVGKDDSDAGDNRLEPWNGVHGGLEPWRVLPFRTTV